MVEASRVQKLLIDQNNEINRLRNRIEQLEAALRKIAAIEDEHINIPKTNEGANLWICLAMCIELAEKALEGKRDE